MKGATQFGLGVFAAVLIGAVGCGPGPVATDAVDLNPEGWVSGDTAEMQFTVDVPDHRHDLQFGLRHTDDYPFSNLYLFVELEYPNGRTLTDTLECPLASPEGRWYGEGRHWIDQRIGYKRGVAFPLGGDYTLRVVHAMRRDPLPGLGQIRFALFDQADF